MPLESETFVKDWGLQRRPSAPKVETALAIDRGVTSLAPRTIDGKYFHLPPSPRSTPMFLAVSAMSHRFSLFAMRTKEPLTDLRVDSSTDIMPPPTASRLPNL